MVATELACRRGKGIPGGLTFSIPSLRSRCHELLKKEGKRKAWGEKVEARSAVYWSSLPQSPISQSAKEEKGLEGEFENARSSACAR